MTKLAGKVKARQRKEKEQKQKARKRVYLDKLVKNIKLYDDPALYQMCNAIGKDDIKPIAHELKRVLAATRSGIGLAASQIGIMKSIFVTRLDPTVNSFRVFANPIVIPVGTIEITRKEGCLSYPDFFAKIKRPWKIKVEYTNEFFIKKQEELTDYMARVFLHEFDHLSGECKISEKYFESKKEPTDK